MAKPKTTPTEQSVSDFIDAVPDETKRDDARAVLRLMQQITDQPAVMWGPSIIGFGTYHYVYESGREGDWMLTGFSPRKTALTIYLMSGVERYSELLDKLGKHKTGKSCLYIKRLSDIDMSVLQQLIEQSIEDVKAQDINYS